jgi:hypothetical protein
MTPCEFTFHAFSRARSAAFLLDAASLDEGNPTVRAKLAELAIDLSRIASVTEILAYAMKDQISDKVH